MTNSHSKILQFVADLYIKNIYIVITGISNIADVDLATTSGMFEKQTKSFD